MPNTLNTKNPNTTNLTRVRDYLRGLGFKDEEIGWKQGQNGGTVTLKGIDLLKPAMVQQGRSYASLSDITNALRRTGLSPQQQQQQQYRMQMSDILSRLRQRATQPFTYKPEEDPAYQAALEEAKRQAELASQRAMEELNVRGILPSTITRDQIANIQQRYMGQVQSQILPQLIQQAYTRRQSELSNLLNLLGAYQGLEQTEYERARQAELDALAREQAQLEQQQREFDNALSLAQQLGYVSNEAASILGVEPGTQTADAREAIARRQLQLQIARENNAAALQRLREQYKLKQQLMEQDPEYQVKQQLWNKINNYGLDFLTDDEKVLAQSLLGIEIPGEEPTEIDQVQTNKALSRFLPLSIKERKEFLSDEQKLAALARKGVDIEKLYLYKNWQGGE